MRVLDIKQKLDEIEFPAAGICLGDFDVIGNFTALKRRQPDDPLYRTAGAFFRPDYERGILAYYMVRRFELRTVLDVGLGRGFVSFCVAKAMCDMGWLEASVTALAPAVDENHFKGLTQVLPRELFSKINIVVGSMEQAFGGMKDQKFDLIILSGGNDRVAEGLTYTRNRFTRFMQVDGYDESVPLGVKALVDSFDGYEKELVRTDRRLFVDERGIADDAPGYGQVLLKAPDFDTAAFLCDW